MPERPVSSHVTVRMIGCGDPAGCCPARVFRLGRRRVLERVYAIRVGYTWQRCRTRVFKPNRTDGFIGEIMFLSVDSWCWNPLRPAATRCDPQQGVMPTAD